MIVTIIPDTTLLPFLAPCELIFIIVFDGTEEFVKVVVSSAIGDAVEVLLLSVLENVVDVSFLVTVDDAGEVTLLGAIVPVLAFIGVDVLLVVVLFMF